MGEVLYLFKNVKKVDEETTSRIPSGAVKIKIDRDLISDIICEIESIKELLDSGILENLEIYADEIDIGQVIDRFHSNYNRRVLGTSFSSEEIMQIFRHNEYTDAEIVEALIFASDPVEANIYNINNEIYSYCISEWEHQINVSSWDKLNELVEKATDEELSVINELNGISEVNRNSFILYSAPFERVAWIIDAQKFEDLISDLKNPFLEEVGNE